MKQPLPPELTPLGKEILNYLNTHPTGEKVAHIANAVGTTHQIAQRYLYRLRTRRFVRLEGSKPQYWYPQTERENK